MQPFIRVVIPYIEKKENMAWILVVVTCFSHEMAIRKGHNVICQVVLIRRGRGRVPTS